MADQQLGFDWGGAEDMGPPSGPLPGIRPLAARLRRLAEQGVYLGTSSWKYPGWLGQVYDPARYQVRGKFAKRRFEQECLAEYAMIFPTVGGDFSFYQFPPPEAWERILAQVPEGFRFSLKAPEEVTAERFPKLPRFGELGGAENPHFMDAGVLNDKLLAPLEAHRGKLGVLILEFGTIRRPPMSRPREFAAALDRLLAGLPLDRFKFAVEVRNEEFLAAGGEYLACLRAHGVAHCLNSWTRMPAIAEQMRVDGVYTADHIAARFLLRPGRMYQQAVDMFSPYERVQEPYPQGRAALRELIERCLAGRRTLFAFVNNRFEGNAVQTIAETIGEQD